MVTRYPSILIKNCLSKNKYISIHSLFKKNGTRTKKSFVVQSKGDPFLLRLTKDKTILNIAILG